VIGQVGRGFEDEEIIRVGRVDTKVEY